MTTIAAKNDFRVTFNGSETYLVVDGNDDCWKRYKSKTAAIRFMNKVA
jgi:hypothetical protein